MFAILPSLCVDFYKTGHLEMWPNGTTKVYSNLTPRKSRLDGVDSVVVFGIQYFIKEYLINQFNQNFFGKKREDVVRQYKRIMDNCLGEGSANTECMGELWDLGYLPIKIKALPEGTNCPIGVPLLTITNTHDKFYWLVNFLETLLSTTTWCPMTSATIAREYRKILEKYAIETTGSIEGVQWQLHEFAMRGLSSVESCMVSGAGHLLSFTGTDTVPAICFLEEYYNANVEKELVGASIRASEHAQMCAGTKEGERETYRRLIQDVQPDGLISIVSDSWNLWNVLKVILPSLHDAIMFRDGKVIIRPDSSKKSPVEIICGDPEGETEEERKGVVELLWDEFGGHTNELGYKVLDSHVSMVYGDSISLKYSEQICQRLKDKGFVSTSSTEGVGSYSYQMTTRDTLGFAIKATYCEVDGVGREIFKNPITDSGFKRSLKGLLRVEEVDGKIRVRDQVSREEEAGGLLETVFEDGRLLVDHTLSEIRNRLKGEI